MPHNVKWYGWNPDLPDKRDQKYSAPKKVVAALPAKADLRGGCPPVYNQGDLGSCSANAIAGAVEFDLIKENKARIFVPSRLFLYYNERAMEGTVSTDSGARIRDGIKSVARLGDCPESLWPYVISKFAVQPPQNCYSEAQMYKAVQYQRITRKLDQFRGCLASGYPFVFGFTAYSSFESKQVETTGQLDMPAKSEEVVGGHAVLAVGYDDSTKTFLVRNSWGSDWGMSGYYTMPYAYLMDSKLADDYWTIRVVT